MQPVLSSGNLVFKYSSTRVLRQPSIQVPGTRVQDPVYWRCLEQINAGRDTAPGSGANYKFLTVNNFTQGLSHQA